MSPEQYDFWKDFALRMARTCWAGQIRPSTEWIVENVEQFFGSRFDDAQSAATVTGWDSAPDYVCDRMSDFVYDHEERIGYWRIRRDDEARVERYQARLIAQGLDDVVDSKVAEFERLLDDTIEERENKAFEQWEDQWMGPVKCCVRAGLDMATEIGGGVVGFSVGNLRAMYPEGIPEFITRHYKDDLNQAPDNAGVWL